MYKILFLVFSLAFASSACRPRHLINESQSLPEGSWKYADSLMFDTQIQDTSRLYNIAIVVKHTQEFGFQNLYLRITTRFPKGKALEQVLSLDLAEKSGKWLGRCSGDACTIAVPIQQNAYFNETGTYTFTLEQYMRQDTLPGIQEIGLRISDAGPRPK